MANNAPNHNTDEVQLLSQLRQVILREDREELSHLRDRVEDAEWFAEKAYPLIDERINFLKQNFPREFNKSVEAIVDKRLKASQAEILDTIYPVLGTMIKKYINFQFQQLKDSIDEKIKMALDTKSLWKRMKASVFGIKDSDMILSDLGKSVIEAVYVVQRDSGLLIGSASLQDTVDKDAIAGMLTAIKAFVEDAFQKEQEQLELISYAAYKILVHNYHSYYVAMTLSGAISNNEEEKLREDVRDFVQNVLLNHNYNDIDNEQEAISIELERYFMVK